MKTNIKLKINYRINWTWYSSSRRGTEWRCDRFVSPAYWSAKLRYRTRSP